MSAKSSLICSCVCFVIILMMASAAAGLTYKYDPQLFGALTTAPMATTAPSAQTTAPVITTAAPATIVQASAQASSQAAVITTAPTSTPTAAPAPLVAPTQATLAPTLAPTAAPTAAPSPTPSVLAPVALPASYEGLDYPGNDASAIDLTTASSQGLTLASLRNQYPTAVGVAFMTNSSGTPTSLWVKSTYGAPYMFGQGRRWIAFQAPPYSSQSASVQANSLSAAQLSQNLSLYQAPATPAPTVAPTQVQTTAPVIGPTLANQQLQWNNGRVLDCAGGSCGLGAYNQISDPSAINSQYWTYTNNGTLVSKDTGRCLDIYGGGTANQTAVDVWDCHGGPNQNWVWQKNVGSGQGNWQLMNPQSGRCLDIPGGLNKNGAGVQIYDCNSSSSAWAPYTPGGYINKDYVVYTGTGTDLPGNPWLGTLSNAQAKCSTTAGCVGFSRLKSAADTDSGAQNWFKQILSPQTAGQIWQTFVKS